MSACARPLRSATSTRRCAIISDPSGSRCRPPIGDQALAQLGGVVADLDPAGVVVALHGLARGAVARELQRVALPLRLLPAVLLELDHRQPREQPAERAAGADRRQLAMVADEHELDVEAPHVVDELGELARRDHRGLVDDQHRARRDRRQPDGARGPGAAPSRSCSGCPALSCSSRAARRASATPYTRRPLASHASRAAASANVLPVPAWPTTTATPSPSRVSRRTISICSAASDGRRAMRALDRPRRREPDPSGPALDRVLEDPLLERQQLRRRVDALDAGGRNQRGRRDARSDAGRSPSARTTARGERRKRVGEPLDLRHADARRRPAAARTTPAAHRDA